MRAALPMALAGGLLAGCVTTPPPPLQVDLTGRACAASADLRAPSVLVYSDKEQSFDVAFTAADPCVQTAQGPALYHVFQLPGPTPEMTFRIGSAPVGFGLFPIRVQLLDGKGAIKRDFSGDALTFRGNQLTALFRAHPDEFYMVVEGDPGILGHTVARTQETTQVSGAAAGRVYFTIHTGNDSTATYTFTQAGTVTVFLAPTTPPKKE
ncbi:MAG: hypothetical protein ACREHE_14540 [Rhizomicrobium sp.]